MGDLIKIVGVQYAVNSNHVKGEDMTAQEQQKTIEFLTMLDRKHPYVSVKPEPTNETDEEAFVARVASRKAGYVRNREEYKSLAQAALTTSGRGYFRARVKFLQRAIFLLKQKLILLQLCPSCIKTIGKNGSRPCLYFL